MGKERLSAIKRFARARRGATAIEFAMIAIPFFMLIFAILEVAFIFFATTVIENAVQFVARGVRVGTITTEQQFRDQLCDRIRLVADCEEVTVDVRPMDSFGGADEPYDDDGDGDDDDDDDDDDGAVGGLLGGVLDLLSGGGDAMGGSGPQFDAGDPGDIVLARALYEWEIIVPDVGLGLANGPGNTRLIVSTVAFRNEPFTEEAGG